MALPTLDVTGNLTKDIELKFSANGTAVANGTIAANKSKRGQNGEWETIATLFQPFTAFGENAEALASAGRGGNARLVGSLETQQWDDKQTGEKRSMTKLIVDFARVFERQSQGGQQGGFQQSQQGYPQQGQQNYPQQGQGDPWASSQGQQQWGGPNDGPPF